MSKVKVETRKHQIKTFLFKNPNSQFKGIFDHLEKLNLGYNNNKGLDKILKSMIPYEIIKNDKAKPYPTYNVVKSNSFASGFMGDEFRQSVFPISGRELKDGIEKCYFYEMGDPNIDDEYLNEDFETKFVKYMIMRYGFFLLSVFIKGHEQSINNKNFDKTEWMKNALNLFQHQEIDSERLLRLLFNKGKIDEQLNINDKKIKNKIKQVKKAMKELHPEHYFDLELYEKHTENDFEMAKEIGKIITKQNKSKK